MNQDPYQEKKTMLQAIVQCRCPRCTKGYMFKSSPFDLKRFNELKEVCPNCGLRFQVEPGFYQISMYATYLISIAVMIIFGFAAHIIFNKPPLWVYYVAILPPVILISPWNVRYSKVLMLYIFGNVWQSKGKGPSGKNSEKHQENKHIKG